VRFGVPRDNKTLVIEYSTGFLVGIHLQNNSRTTYIFREQTSTRLVLTWHLRYRPWIFECKRKNTRYTDAQSAYKCRPL